MQHKYYDEYKAYLNQEISYDTLLTECNEKLNSYNVEFETLKQTQHLLQLLKSKKISSKRDKILNLINKALLEIFEKNYELKIESNEKLEDIKYDLILYKNGIEISKNDNLLNSNGGGVLSVISVLFKIVIGILHNNEKLFIFDESLAQVSSLYRPKLSSYLRNLCESQGLTIILVSHVDDMDFAAHKTYYLNGKLKKDIDTIYIEKEESKYGSYKPIEKYVVNIEQYQSIEKITLEFSGYTILKGPNDIGKSATIRAISALLYNKFKDSDVRKNKPKGVNTSITFEKFINDILEYNINLKFESNSVFYSINGIEYKGKKNSSTSIKEAFNKIGFNTFIDDEYLKNKSVKTREQLSQLTITTQHDSLYIVENNVNDNTNLFAYIFNAHTVTNATLLIKNDIKNINNKILEITTQIKEYNDKKVLVNQKKEYFYRKYLIELYLTYEQINVKYRKIENELNLISKLINNVNLLKSFYIYTSRLEEFTYKSKLYNCLILNINKLKELLQSLNIYNEHEYKINNARKKLDILLKEKNKINEEILLCEKIQKTYKQSILYKMYFNYIFYGVKLNKCKESLEYVQKILALFKTIYSYKVNDNSNPIFIYENSKSKIELLSKQVNLINNQQLCINNLIKILNNHIEYNNLYSIVSNLNSKKIELNKVNLEILNLKEEFGMCKCEKCNGIGYIFH